MLWRSMENMGCKCLILKTWGCKAGVSQLNGGGCSLYSDRKRHIHSPEIAYLISQKLKNKMHSTLNGAVLSNLYKLGFFFWDLEFLI